MYCWTTANWMRPLYPKVQSMESSCAPVTSRYFTSTVPPKNSIPSSEAWCTWTYSTVVPFPTPWNAIPFSSFVDVKMWPAYSTRT